MREKSSFSFSFPFVHALEKLDPLPFCSSFSQKLDPRARRPEIRDPTESGLTGLWESKVYQKWYKSVPFPKKLAKRLNVNKIPDLCEAKIYVAEGFTTLDL